MKKFVYVAISAFLLAACNADQLEFDDLEVTPIEGPFVFPLGESTYVLRDLLDKQTEGQDFVEDSTSLITFFYNDTITYSAPDDFVTINDIVQSGTTNPPAYLAGAARQETFSASFDLTYDPQDGEILDSLFYLTGDLTILTESEIPADIDYVYTVENTTNINNGTPISVSGTVTNTAAPVDTHTQTESLVNHVTKLSGNNNTFRVNLEATVTLAAAQSLTGLEELRFTLTYGNQTFGLIYGKFGQDVVQVGNQALDIDFFTQANRDGITFGNPSLTFDFRNSFGLPIGVDFSGVYADDGAGNQTFLTGNIVNNPPVIEGSGVNTPTVNTPGETVQSIIEINRTNSSIVNVLGSSPQQLVFDIAGISNPESETELNYLQPTSEITAYVTVEIPMEVQLEDYQETGSFGLGSGFDASNLDSAFIRIVTLNELPFTGTVSLEVQAEDSTVLFPITDESDPRYDSAVTNHPTQIERFTNLPIIKAPLISVNGEVTDPSGDTEDIALTNEEIQLLSGAARVIITMTFNTPVSQTSRDIYVKVLADYTLNLKVGIGTRFNLDL
ncbi:hypothetical protein [Ekhidna sp.]|uniref:hypothetical protein n=1 Tax=Ekhidna sp. TaxID=2608089 RepID=UPI003B59B0F9